MMSRMMFVLRGILGRHWPALILAVMVGFLMVGPQLMVGPNYPLGSDAETHYLARINNFAHTYELGSPYLAEYRSEPSPTPMYLEEMLSLPLIVFPLSVTSLNLLYKFFFPVIIFLLGYSFLLRLVGSKVWSLAGASFIMLGPSLINAPDILNLLSWNEAYRQFAIYARPVNPQFSAIFFFSFLHCFLSAWRTRENRWFWYLATILGVSFYLYFFLFTFLLAVLFMAVAVCFLAGRWGESKKYLGSLLGGFIIGSPIIVKILQVYGHPWFSALAGDYNMSTVRRPVIGLAAIIGALALVLGFNLQRKLEIKKDDLLFLLILLGTSFLAVNQQLVTGIILQEGHYHWYYNTPIFITILFFVSWQLLKKLNRKIMTSLAVVAILLAVSSTVLIQLSSFHYWEPIVKAEQKYQPIFSWLKANTKSGDVILANDRLSELLPVYTSNRIIYHPYAGLYLMSPERRAYTQSYIMADFSRRRHQYRLDYIVWDKKEDPEWRLNLYSFIHPLYEDENFVIYKN